jgi:hypothetical protein
MSSPDEAPNRALLPILSEAYPLFLRLASDFAWTPTLYLLSPVIAIAAFGYTLLIEWPLVLGLTLLELVHPLYTFFGATLLIAAIFGIVANGVTWVVQYVIADQAKKGAAARVKLEDGVYIKEE